MRRRWAVRTAGSVATGILATALLLAWEATLDAPGTATVAPVGAAAAGAVVAIALLPATARYPQGVLRRAKRVALGAGLGFGVVGFAGYAGAVVLPDPLALLAAGITLVVVLPVGYERGWRAVSEPRTLVAGDDRTSVRRTAATIDPSPVGYCAPPARSTRSEGSAPARSRSAAVLPGRAGTSRSATEPTVQRDGGTAHRSEPDAVQQPDGGSVRRTAGGRGHSPADVSPTAQPSTSLPAPADAPRGVGEPLESESPDAERLGGLAAMDRVVRDRGVDAVVLQFGSADREDFFGALRTCHDAGVDAFVPRSEAKSVVLADQHRSLREVEREPVGIAPQRRQPTDGGATDADATAGGGTEGGATEAGATVGGGTEAGATAGGAAEAGATAGSGSEEAPPELDRTVRGFEAEGTALARVALEVRPWYGRLAKRGFDLAFATVGILALSPLMTVIAIAIRLDSPGPVLYGQWRTGHLGEPFQLLKFRSMVSDAEAATGPRLSDEDAGGIDPRVTRVGRVLRATHLDELPQLFSIFVGEMSVVGPRPERPALDAEITADGVAWRQRWFRRPGLTGLAQINDVTGFQPREKLAYDLEYAQRQSLALDVRIVAIQLGQVAGDVLELIARRIP